MYHDYFIETLKYYPCLFNMYALNQLLYQG